MGVSADNANLVQFYEVGDTEAVVPLMLEPLQDADWGLISGDGRTFIAGGALNATAALDDNDNGQVNFFVKYREGSLHMKVGPSIRKPASMMDILGVDPRRCLLMVP
jgi:hypothetical protein